MSQPTHDPLCPKKDFYVCYQCKKQFFGYINPKWKKVNAGAAYRGICSTCDRSNKRVGQDEVGQGYLF